MNTGEVIGVMIAILLASSMAMLGLTFGLERGQKQACESVKLEWVQDKCMKVTREAV